MNEIVSSFEDQREKLVMCIWKVWKVLHIRVRTEWN